MKKYSKFLILIFIIVIFIPLISCKGKESSEEKELNIFLSLEGKAQSEEVNYIIDNFKKEYPKIKINLNVNNSNEDNLKGKNIDIVFLNRNSLLEISNKGFLSNLNGIYNDEKLNEKNYDISNIYGRVGTEYYGIPISVSSLEFLYNKDFLKAHGKEEPKNIIQWFNLVKEFKDYGITVPIVTENYINSVELFTLIVSNNLINLKELDDKYDNAQKSYKETSNIQELFNSIHNVITSGYVSNESLSSFQESGDSIHVNKENPFLITTSYYTELINNINFGIVNQYKNNDGKNINIPVFCSTIVSIPMDCKNEEDAQRFIKFFISEDFQKKMVKDNHITINKEANRSFSGNITEAICHINNASENNIAFNAMIPKKLYIKIIEKVKKIFNGEYTGAEWQEILS